MKLDAVRDSLEGTNISKMDVNVNSLTYSLMIDGIYTNKLGSVIREVSTNARDSLLSVNKDSFLITIFLDPVSKDIKLSFKDEGLGLSEEDSLTYLCNLNASTKRDSNEFVGCFGIGSKSPFSLTDSYSFKCIKDGIKTNLDLFRIDKETPRFSHTTEDTNEVDSVECIINLGSSYPLESILKDIYKELSLFDIQPDIKFITPEDTYTIPAKDFFPEVREFENHFRIFEPSMSEESLNYLESIGINCGIHLLNSIDDSYRSSKSVACGVISYKYDPLHSNNSGYARYRNHSFNGIPKLPYFSILKFGLGEELSFDVSRENIDISSSSEELIYQKVLGLYTETDLKFINEFLVTVKTITFMFPYPRVISNIFNNSSFSVFNTTDNSFQKTTKILDKIKNSFDYFKTKPDFMNLLFGLKGQYHFLFDSKYVGKLNHPREFASLKDNLDSTLNPDLIYFLEKVLCDDNYFYEDSFNKGLKSILNPKVLSDQNSLGSICKNIFSNFNTEIIKRLFYIGGSITDLSKLKIDFIYTNSRLKSERDIQDLKNNYREEKSLIPDNTLVVLVNSSKRLIEDNNLISNLEAVRLLTDVSTYSLKAYEEINPEFSLAVRPEAKLKKSSEDSSPKEFSESNIKLRNNITVVESTFRTVFPDRVRGENGITHQPPATEFKFLTGTEETTSVKFSKKISTQLPQFSDNSSRSHFGPRNCFVILVPKDLVANQEEKDAIIISENFSECKAYFEFENSNYQDIKDVFDSLYLSSDLVKKSMKTYPRIVYLELNKDYFDGSFLEDYRTFQGLCISRFNNLKSYFETLDAIEVPEECSEYLKSLGTTPIFYGKSPIIISDKSLKLHKFLTSLGSAIRYDYLPQFRYIHILYILNGNGKAEFPLSLDKSFSDNSLSTSLAGVQHHLDTLGRFLDSNLDNLFYKMIDKEYLDGVEEEFKGSTITVNTEEITNLLKRF